MTVLDDIAEHLRRVAPRALCDDCLAQATRITPRQHANQKSRRLAEEPGFDRRTDRCASCGATKLVIRAT